MELNEYLTNSRNKRNELLKTAQSYLQQNTQNTLKNSPVPPESENIYSGPNPKGLQEFENEVTYHLKKIFKPSLNEKSQRIASVLIQSVDRNIRKIYTKNAERLRKNKQLIMIPKDHCCGYVKVPQRVRKSKNFSIMPEIANESKLLSSVQRETQSFRKSCQGNLLLPILSTAGSHEYRSKVYKY